jgi:hypothetical protein
VVHKNPGNRADDGHGKHEPDGDRGDLNRRAMPAERDETDNAEEGQKVAKHADKLGEPKRAEWLVLQNCFYRKGLRHLCGSAHESLLVLREDYRKPAPLCAATNTKNSTAAIEQNQNANHLSPAAACASKNPS